MITRYDDWSHQVRLCCQNLYGSSKNVRYSKKRQKVAFASFHVRRTMNDLDLEVRTIVNYVQAQQQHHHQHDQNFTCHTSYYQQGNRAKPVQIPLIRHNLVLALLVALQLTSVAIVSLHPQRRVMHYRQLKRTFASRDYFCLRHQQTTSSSDRNKNRNSYRWMSSPTSTPPTTTTDTAHPTAIINETIVTNTFRLAPYVSTDDDEKYTSIRKSSSNHQFLEIPERNDSLVTTFGVQNRNDRHDSANKHINTPPFYATVRDRGLVLPILNDSITQPSDDIKNENKNQTIPTLVKLASNVTSSVLWKIIQRFSFLTGLKVWWRRIRIQLNENKSPLTQQPVITLRSIWRHRHARSAEEGIRREFASIQAIHQGLPSGSDIVNDINDNIIPIKNEKKIDADSDKTVVPKNNHRRSARQLSSIFAKANASIERTSRRVAARTLTGLITAMAEEVQDLNVEVDARDETPYRNKHITAVRIQFSRLGFKPLRLGGHNSPTDRRQQREAVTNHHFLLMDQFRFQKKAADKSIRNKRLALVDDVNFSDGKDDSRLDRIDADEAFDRIDVDKSGFLDRKELIQALGLAAIVSNDKTLVLEDMESDSHVSILEELASDLFELYDVNGDGVVDRREYKMMVADMAALRKRDQRRRRETEAVSDQDEHHDQNNWFTSSYDFFQNKTNAAIASSVEYVQNKTGFLSPSVEYMQSKSGFLSSGVSTGFEYIQNKTGLLKTGVSTGVGYGVEYVQNTTGYFASSSIDFFQNNTNFAEYVQNNSELLTNSMEFVKGKLPWPPEQNIASTSSSTSPFLDTAEVSESSSKSLGSITFSDVKMDLRRLFFGAIPILKNLVPGGPLILEPFTTTITGSFTRSDMMNSFLLDAGLRRLVMRALRRRVGFLRDALEGAMFKGRSWKTFGDETGGGPRVEIPELTNVEFDDNDKLIITGRARVQTSPDAAVINQSFKVRTSIGTRKDGRFIRLEEPELALVIECPEIWETNMGRLCRELTIEPPTRPSPLYTFFPIYSPFKLQDDDGFDLGEDNSVTSLYIKDGALRFEMSAVLRPGRFLGSHYVAFSIPIRTFIVTLDRLVEGIRSARKVKKAAQRALSSSDRSVRNKFWLRRISFDRAGDALLRLNEDRVTYTSISTTHKKLKIKSFFSRFIDGYLQAERDETKKERLTTAIQDFFGRQGI